MDMALKGVPKTPEHRAAISAALKGKSRALGSGRPENTPEVLWSKVDKQGPNECWPWIGFRNEYGYGRTEIKKVAYYAHRVIFDLVNPGQITRAAPKNMHSDQFIRHTCDNPPCCNPAHLVRGTHRENMRDKVVRGRMPDFSRDKGPRCKLTMEQVAEIRRIAGYGISSGEIARLFDVSKPTAKSAISGRHYKAN
jgi:hypothetical protein